MEEKAPPIGKVQRLMESLRKIGPVGTIGWIYERTLQYTLHHLRNKPKRPKDMGAENIRFHIVVPVYNTPLRYLRKMVGSVQAQWYGNWVLHAEDGGSTNPKVYETLKELAAGDSRIQARRYEENLGISGNTNRILAGLQEVPGDDYVVFCDHDDLITPDALYAVAEAIRKTGADFVYSDEDCITANSLYLFSPRHKPDFAPDNLRSTNYICHLSIISKALLDKVGPLNPEMDGSQDHDFVLRVSEQASKIAHVPRVLYHWRQFRRSMSKTSLDRCLAAGIRAVQEHIDRLCEEGDVTVVGNHYRHRYPLQGRPPVTAIVYIAKDDTREQVLTCIQDLKESAYDPLDIRLVADSGWATPAGFALEIYQSSTAKTKWDLLREAAEGVQGAYLLFIAASVRLRPDGSLQELLSHAQRARRGVIGPRVLYPNMLFFGAGPTRREDGSVYVPPKDKKDKYRHLQHGVGFYIHNPYAVNDGCFMISKELFIEGAEKAAKSADAFVAALCVCLRETGNYPVYTPYATAALQGDDVGDPLIGS